MSASTAEAIALTWFGPYSLEPGAGNSVWVGSVSSCQGLYLWAVPAQGRYLVHRVEVTGLPFWQRYHQHLMAYGRGEYTIHRATSLLAGRRDPLHRPLRRRGPHRLRDQRRFHNQRPKLSVEIRALLAGLVVYQAPFAGGLRLRERLEAAVVAHLRAGGHQAAALLEAPFHRGHRLPTEPPVVVRSPLPAVVAGMPGEVEV